MHYRIILFIAFFISSVSSFAQIDSAVKEMRWKVTTLLMQDRSDFYNGFHPTYLNGIGVKFRTKYVTLRAGLEHYGYFDNDTETRFKLGVERGVLILNRVRPYLAAEVYGVYEKSESYSISQIYPIYDDYRYEYNGLGVGGMYSLGIECIISKYISISVETRLIHESVKVDSKNTNLITGSVYEETNYKNGKRLESLGMVCLEIRLP